MNTNFNPDDHPRSQDGKFTEKPHLEAAGGLGALIADDTSPELVAALERYGVHLEDVPPDHEGVTLNERWEDLRALADAPDVPTVAQTIRQVLDIDDFGRERGGPELVWATPEGWFDVDNDLPANDPNDPRWDDDTTLAAMVYTRNGGGNRECWCSDEGSKHTPGNCLAATIEQLQSHPAHLYDEDDGFDSTYASFYFRVPKADPRIREAVSLVREASEQQAARRMLRDVESGRTTPWSLMPQNPATVKKLESLSAQVEKLREKATEPARQHGWSRDSKTELWAAGVFTPAHADEVDAVLAYASGGPLPADSPIKTRNDTTWRTTQRWNTSTDLDLRHLVSDETKAREYEARAAQVVAARAVMDTMPPDVRAVLEAGLDSFDLRHAERDAKKWRASVAKKAGELSRARRAQQARHDAREKMDGLTATMNEYRANVGWPGKPGTWPTRVETHDDESSLLNAPVNTQT